MLDYSDDDHATINLGKIADFLLGPNDGYYLTIPEVARYLKLSRSKVYLLVTQKKIPYIRIGKNVRIRQSDLETWLNQRVVK